MNADLFGRTAALRKESDPFGLKTNRETESNSEKHVPKKKYESFFFVCSVSRFTAKPAYTSLSEWKKHIYKDRKDETERKRMRKKKEGNERQNRPKKEI